MRLLPGHEVTLLESNGDGAPPGGPYRSTEDPRPRCPIGFCPACAATVELMIRAGLVGDTARDAHELIHDVQEKAKALSDVRAAARREFIGATFTLALWVIVLLVVALGVR